MPTRRSGQISNPGAFGAMYTQQAPGSSATTWGYAPDGGLMGYNRALGRAVPISGAMPEQSPDMNPVGLSGLLGGTAPMPPERPAGLGGPTWAGNFEPQYDTSNTTSMDTNMFADAAQQGQVGASGFWGLGSGWGDTALAARPPAMSNVPPPEALSGYPTAQDFEANFPGLLSWMPSLPDWGTLSPQSEFDTNYWGNPQMASTGDLSQLPQVPTPPVRPFDLGVKPLAPAAAAPGVGINPEMVSAPAASKGAYGTPSNPLSGAYMAKFGLGDAPIGSPVGGAGLGDAPSGTGWGTGMGIGLGLLGGAAAGPVGALAGGLAGKYLGGLLGQRGANLTPGFQPNGGPQGQAGIRFTDGSWGNQSQGPSPGSVGPGTSGLY